MRLSRAGAIAALALGLGGCVTWKPYEPAAPLADSTGLPYRLRVTSADTTRVKLTSPFVRADSLYGRWSPRDTLAVPVANIRQLERERFNIWRTLGLAAALPAAAILTLFVVFCAGGGCEATY